MLLFLLFLFPPGEIRAARAGAPEVVRSACEYDYPPLSMTDEAGHPTGFSVELLEAALGAMGREVVFRTGPWAEVRTWLERGEVDALPLVGRTPEREAIFDFTFPYLSLHGAIVVREDNRDIREWDDLRGRAVAVMRGDNAEEFLRRSDGGMEIRTVETFDRALKELSEGSHDAVVVQRLLALRLIRQADIRNLRLLEGPLADFRQDFCFAVRDGDAEMLALLNEALALVMADGTFRQLHAKWFAALELSSRKRIVVGGDRNYPPYEYLDESGNPAGYLVELTRAVAREAGLEVDIRLGPWSEIREGLERGRIDAVQGMLYTPERDLLLDFGPPHTAIHQVAAVRRADEPPPSTVAELAGKWIVAMRGDILHDFALENGLESRLTTVDSLEDALRELAAGHHDCALVPRLPALHLIRENEWENLTVGRKPFLSPQGSYATLSNRKALLARLNEGLKTVEETGEFRRIREKWLGVFEETRPDPVALLKYGALVFGPLLVVFLALLLRSRTVTNAERQRAAAALRESESRFAEATRAGQISIWEWDIEGRELHHDPLFWRNLGYEPEAASETPDLWRRIIHPDDAERMKVAACACVSGDRPFYEVEHRILDREGGVRWVFARGRMKDGSRRMIGTVQDITDRKRAEQALVESEEKYRLLTEMAPIGTALLLEKRIVFANERAARIFGRETPEALVGETPETLVREPDRGSAAENMRTLMVDRQPVPWVERRIRRPDGTELDVEISAVPIVYQGQPAIQACLRDVTERKRLEAERRELDRRLETARRHESLATMAGAIAHNFNNILMTVLGNLDMALEDHLRVDPARDLVVEARRAAWRAAKLSRLMNLYVGHERENHTGFCLLDLIRSHRSQLVDRVPEDIALSLEPAEAISEFPVKGDAARIFEALIGLVENAVEAIGAGPGKIGVRVIRETVSAGEPDAEYALENPSPGDYIGVSVADTGCGMDEKTRRRLFEPFYTTKFTGRGLGLAVVLGIVRSHGGAVRVRSEPGAGTTVALLFPAG